jgi:hypothetical protein
MSVLSTTVQKQVEKAIVEQGLITAEEFRKVRDTADKKGEPLFSAMITTGQSIQ